MRRASGARAPARLGSPVQSQLRTTSATKAATIADTCDMYICFASLGYSVRTFTTALDKIAISTQEKHWRRIAKLILRTQPTLP